MALPKTFRDVEAGWGKDNSSLECELLLHDFFRREEGYSAEHPLILCRDGGLMALYSMDGLDPETMDEDGLEGSSTAIRRSIDVLNPMNQEGEWRHGVWEVQNIWTRSLGAAPTLAQPTRDSAALRYLVNASNNYWQERVVFEDSILWVFRYLPRFREKNLLTWRVWRLRDSTDEAVVKLKVLQEQARMFRRTMRVVEENLMAFSVRRPKMGFGFRALSELDSYKAIWRVVNRRWGEPMAYRPELPLVTQVALSTRDNSGEHYTINGRSTKVLTWKIPPATSIAYVLARLQNQVRFPVTVTQTFRRLDFAVLSGRVARLGNFAAALAKCHRESAAYSAEAQDFLGSVRTEGACPCNWYFSVFIRAHLGVIVAMDFLTVEAVTWLGLVRYHVLFAIDRASRKVEILGIAVNPGGHWMEQMARNLVDATDGFLLGKRYVLLDRDPLYTQAFRRILDQAGVKTVRLPAHSPNLNAFAELSL